MDVHREFADTAITFPVPVRSSTGPPDNFAIDLRNHRWVTTSDGSKPGPPIFRSSLFGFIRGDAVLNALIVNFSDGRSVVQGGVSNLHAIRLCTFVRATT